MTLEECLVEAKRFEDERQMAGFDQAALDQAGRTGLANGTFEDGTEDLGAVVEEFFSDVQSARSDVTDTVSVNVASAEAQRGLTARLQAKPDLPRSET